jgi:hypothetical protein
VWLTIGYSRLMLPRLGLLVARGRSEPKPNATRFGSITTSGTNAAAIVPIRKAGDKSNLNAESGCYTLAQIAQIPVALP